MSVQDGVCAMRMCDENAVVSSYGFYWEFASLIRMDSVCFFKHCTYAFLHLGSIVE